MLQLADFIETLPDHKFDMNYWVGQKERAGEDKEWITTHYPTTYSASSINEESQTKYEPFDCGTACCIAGWAAMIQNDLKPMPYFIDNKTIENRAIEWLGLTKQEADNLFYLGMDTVWSDYIAHMDFDFDDYEENYINIKNKHAAIVIRDIANGDTDISNEYDYYECKNHLQNLGYLDEDEDDEY